MLVKEIKTALRITHNKFDDEIEQQILSCVADMRRIGIAVPLPPFYEFIDENPLIFTAVKLYCMAQFDFLSKGDQYKKGYESLRDVLSMSGTYKESDGDV